MSKQNSDLFRRLTNVKHADLKPVPVKKRNTGLFDKIVISGEITASPEISDEIKSYERPPLVYIDLTDEIQMHQGLFKPFDRIDTSALIQNINNFKNLDLKTVDDKELLGMVNLIVTNNIVSSKVANEGAIFYRARNKTFTIENDGRTTHDVFQSFSEVWYPHPKYLNKLGRLNLARQPMFYASQDAITPIHEIRSENGNQFAIMKYQVKKGQSLQLAVIALNSYEELIKSTKENFRYNWTKKGKKNWRIINDFLKGEFTKHVSEGHEYEYRSTNALLGSFNYPGCDGFVYPSIARNGGYNLAIKPEAADRAAEFIGLSYWQNTNYDNKRVRSQDFHCLKYWATKSENGKIIYEPIGPCQIDFSGLKVDDSVTYRQLPRKAQS